MRLGKTQIMVFVLDNTEYGIDIRNINCIVKASILNIVAIPESTDVFEGYAVLRGNVYPVLNLRRKFNLPYVPINSDTKMIIIKITEGFVGILVDDVTDLFKMEEQDISAVFTGTHYQKQYIKGVAHLNDRLIIVLDVEEILNTEEKVVIAYPGDASCQGDGSPDTAPFSNAD